MAKSLSNNLNLKDYYCCDINSFHDNYLCPYEHATENSALKKIDVRRMICPFNLAGNCVYEKHCIFAHLNHSESQKEGSNPVEVEGDQVNATTSHSSNIVSEELEPVSIVSEIQECGICQESIEPGRFAKSIFGILLNCNHSFCLECIKKWRDQGKECEHTIIHPLDELWDDSESDEFEEVLNRIDPEIARSCPVCRTASNFVVPSYRWVKGEADKLKLVASFKEKNSKINCRYFTRDGLCRFGKNCLFLHSAYHSKAVRERFHALSIFDTTE